MIKLAVKEAKSWKEKVEGLIGKKKPQSLMLRTRFGIHTFGVKFPIDVLILNSQNRVVSMRKNMLPNKIYLWNPIYEKVIELPSGTIKKKGVKIRSAVRLSL